MNSSISINYWLCSDTHFGHKRMPELCNRPIGYEEKILRNIKKTVKQEDILIHLGDFSLGNRDQYWQEQFLEHTDCTRILVLGNHDRHRSISWYISHGWHFVCNSFVLEMFGEKILFTHEPKKDLHGTMATKNIHGHLHNKLSFTSPKHILIAQEFTNYQLVSLQSLIEKHQKESLKNEQEN